MSENYALAPTSLALDAGLPAADGSARDAGPIAAGDVPGEGAFPSEAPLFVAASTPPWTLAMSASSDIVVTFVNGPLEARSLASDVRVVDAAHNDVGAMVLPEADAVRLVAPPGGWPAGAIVELNAGIRTDDGRALASPVLLPLIIE